MSGDVDEVNGVSQGAGETGRGATTKSQDLRSLCGFVVLCCYGCNVTLIDCVPLATSSMPF